jgi:predicted MFS family arabinose efflux permease
VSRPAATRPVGLRLGLRANLAQFSLLVGVGALLAGLVADAAGLEAAVWVVAALTAASGVVVAVRMYETHRPAERP